jgi:hypothetical protein
MSYLNNKQIKSLCKLLPKPEIFNRKRQRVFTSLYNFDVTRVEMYMIEELIYKMSNDYWKGNKVPETYFHASNQLLLTNIDLCLN